MANRRSNYGGYSGWNQLITGARNRQSTLPNVGGMFMLGLQDSRKNNELRILEKKLKLQEQEKAVIDALNNEAWSPDMEELSPWAAEMMTNNLLDMKNKYFEATSKGLGRDAGVADRAEAARLQKEIMNATSKMGADFLNLDNATQEYMNNHGNLSWAGRKKETFLNYIHKDAKKRVDQKTGAVYITPFGGGKEISITKFLEMYPMQIPNDLFDAMGTMAQQHQKLFWDGNYGGKTEAKDNGLLQALTIDTKKNINLVTSRDENANRNDMILSLIEEWDPEHGQKFSDDERYTQLQEAWQGLYPDDKGEWIHGDDEQMLELRKKVNDFQSLEDEYTNWSSEKYFTWITGRPAPTQAPSAADQVAMKNANTALFKAKTARLDNMNKAYETELARLNEEGNTNNVYDHVIGDYGLGLTIDNNGKLNSTIEVGERTVPGNAASFVAASNQMSRGGGSSNPLVETKEQITAKMLEHYSGVTPSVSSDLGYTKHVNFDMLSKDELLNNLNVGTEEGWNIDVSIVNDNLKDSWNESRGEGGVGYIPDNIITPGAYVQFTTTGPVGGTTKSDDLPERNDDETRNWEIENNDGVTGKARYLARVTEHINAKDQVTSSSGKTKQWQVLFNGDMKDFVQKIVQGLSDEGVEFVPTKEQRTNEAARKRENEKLALEHVNNIYGVN